MTTKKTGRSGLPVVNADNTKSSTPRGRPRMRGYLLALVKEFRSELEKAKLDRDWSAVELFEWVKRKEREYGSE